MLNNEVVITRTQPSFRGHDEANIIFELLVCLLAGIFRERQRIEPEYAWSPRTNLEERAFIIVGVFNLDPGYAYGLERSWRDVTGARTIYHHLHNVNILHIKKVFTYSI